MAQLEHVNASKARNNILRLLLSIITNPYKYTLRGKHGCPHHGARLMPFLFTSLGGIFMGAVLFNGNVGNRGAASLSELLPNV
jgi:hypothetical protein